MNVSQNFLKKKLLSGSAWAFTGRVITAFSGVLINALLSRLLSPEAMGTYFLTLSLVTGLVGISQLGITSTAMRLIAESMSTNRPGRALKTIQLSFKYSVLGTFIVAAILVIGIGEWLAEQVFNSVLMMNIVGLMTIWIIILTFQSLIAEIFRGFHDIRSATMCGLITSVLSVLFFAGLWIGLGHSNIKHVVTFSIFASAISVSIASWLMWNKLQTLGKMTDDLTDQELLIIAWPLWITNLTLFALGQADLWILGIFSPQEVAIYGAVSRLVALVTMPLIIINTVLSPLISELYAQNNKYQLEQVLRTTATITSIPAIIVLTIFILFGDPILKIIYGNYYREGAIVLTLLSLAQLVNVWAGSCGQTLIMTGHQMTMMLITIICSSVAIISSIGLVQKYGVIGVATASSLALILQNSLMLLMVRLKTTMWTHFSIKIVFNLNKILNLR
ncbi:polysaccharide biosynthesis protein [Thioploca ingrica]|uniref:Polysaccharide biosynthesis protein n=1 Tax=Thioploca ingrica TaxID=40754 RepID=A0A090ALJ8_9GAMM|nr:polysaccharide biosynthesis protein [Thioploca ingrica]